MAKPEKSLVTYPLELVTKEKPKDYSVFCRGHFLCLRALTNDSLTDVGQTGAILLSELGKSMHKYVGHTVLR